MSSSPPSAYEYSGHALLWRCEKILTHYHSWIVRRFARALPGDKAGASGVLDFGAGIGTLSVLFAAMTGHKPVTVETDPAQRDTLRARGFLSYASLDEIEERFDLIYSSNVLEHIDDDVAALKALRGRLSENGRLAIYVPAFMFLWSPLDDKVGHRRRYTKKTLAEKLALAGFRLEELYYCDAAGFFLTLLFKRIGDGSGEPGERSLFIFDKILFPLGLALGVFTRKYFGKNVMAIAVGA